MLSAEVLYSSTVYKEIPRKIPIEGYTDNHIHIDPINGEGLNAVKKFEHAGGRFIFLVCKTTADWKLQPTEEGLLKLSDKTISISKTINKETNVKSFPVIGIHPADFVLMCNRFSIKVAKEIGFKVIEKMGEKILNEEAIALGEVGRPHFEVENEVYKACNDFLLKIMETAADINCAVQLHTETVTDTHFTEFREMALQAGLKPYKVIKHYSPPLIKAGEKTGILPSLIASKENIARAVREGNRFLMESDYIDDLSRPGAVVGPKSVPKISRLLYERGVINEEDLWKIHKDNIEHAYGISLDY